MPGICNPTASHDDHMILKIRGITLIKDVMAGGEKMIVTDDLLMEAILSL